MSDTIKQISIKTPSNLEEGEFIDEIRDIGADANNITLYKNGSNQYTDDITADGKESLTEFAQNHSRIKNGTVTGSTIENLVELDSQGKVNTARGNYSHAEGYNTKANGSYSHAEGMGTIAQGKSQTVIGEFNIVQGTETSKENTDYAFIIGNGSNNSRSNAFAVKWDGTIVLANGTELSVAQLAKVANLT